MGEEGIILTLKVGYALLLSAKNTLLLQHLHGKQGKNHGKGKHNGGFKHAGALFLGFFALCAAFIAGRGLAAALIIAALHAAALLLLRTISAAVYGPIGKIVIVYPLCAAASHACSPFFFVKTVRKISPYSLL